MKKSILITLAAAILPSIYSMAGTQSQPPRGPKNIILFIGDGMSVPQRMVAEEYSRKIGREPLAMNSFMCQATTRTCSASSLVTDSAASGTAIACGTKTTNGAIGVDKDGKRLESCAEFAKKAGWKVGIVTSVTINHATPAAFYAHRPHRSMLYEIGLDLLASDFDLFMGGGLAWAMNSTNSPEYRGNLYDLASSNGWVVAKGRAGFNSLPAKYKKGSHVWWVGCEEALPYAIDSANDDTPRLPEITRYALNYLKDNFFIMIEGGRIDYAGHSNDAATTLRDTLELDDAIKVALDFASRNPDTLIIVAGDHETGGMSMGFAGTGYAFYMERLEHQKASVDEFKHLLEEKKNQMGEKFSFDVAKAMLEEYFGFKFDGDPNDPMFVDARDVESFKRHFAKGDIHDKARRLISAKAGVGWTTGSHTGLPALTTAKGPGSRLFTGLLDNTDISKKIKTLISNGK